MPMQSRFQERRSDFRRRADDVIRWKRPGQIEDQKAWLLDRSSGGLGFYVDAAFTPQPGEELHIRKLDGDRWAPVEGTIRVARVTPSPTGDLALVGCLIQGSAG